MKRFFSFVLAGLVCFQINAFSQTTTFNYTGTVQTYTVPAGVSAITVDVQGAMGGGVNCAYGNYQSIGGCGGRVQATVAVTPGHVLNITVGQKPGNTGGGGYGGGGNDLAAFTTTWPGAGGGGATTIYDNTSATTLVIAGGGGGGGGDFCPSAGFGTGVGDIGGAGGGLTAGAGNANACGTGLGGSGGSQIAGGAGGVCLGTGTTGSFGAGANCTLGVGSGAGGGGYYGGGSGYEGGGGGGGSSYTNATFASSVTHTPGYNCANGIAIITVTCSAGTVNGTLSICAGSTTNLTDATAGGVWSSSTTAVGTISTTGVVTGLTAGTTTISYTAGGCSALAIVTVYPVPSAISGTTSMCQGASTTLTDAVAGGVWGNSAGSGSVTNIGGVITGATAGTAIVSYSFGGGLCYQTTIVTVNASPGPINGTASVCTGLTTSLTDGVAGGTWSSSNPGVGSVSIGSGTVTGVSGGTTTISYIMPGNCYVTTTVTVNPVPSAINGTLTVCQGSTTTLTNTVGGGVWSSTNLIVGTISTTGIVTGISGGTTTISYTSANCTPVTAVVTVNPVSPISGAPFTVCTGLTATLTDALSGTWSSSNTAVALIGSASGVITGVSAGTATIVFTFLSGCTTNVTFTVNPSPVAISGPATLCNGNSASFSDGTPGGTWTSSNTAVGTVAPSGGIVTAIGAGTTTVSYTLSAGCTSTAILTVNPVPAFISGTLNVCVGLSTTLTDATAGGTWADNNGAVASIGASTGTILGMTPGTTVISYSLPTGCYTLAVFTVNPSPSAILGNHSMCLYSNTALTDLSSGGTWSSSNTAIGTIGSVTGIAYGAITGTTNITYTLAAGCIATTTVTVNPLPMAISGTSSGCIGFTTTLSDATFGGTWSSSNPDVAISSTTGYLTALSPGSDTISYILSTGCLSSFVFTVNPQPAAISGVSYVCAGLMTTLTDATAGGSWSSSNPTVGTIGSISGTVTCIAPGVVDIIYTLPTACYTTYPITINTPPTAISGPDNVCANSAITLSNGTSSGTWSITDFTGDASINTTGVLTGISAGVVVVSYTTFSCNPAIYPVTVNPLPAAIIGVGNICLGSSTSLTDVTAGGTWSSSDAAVSVSSTGVVSGVDTGAGTIISYTLPTGCYVTVPVIVFPIPAPIQGIDSVCPGDSVTLSDPTPLGVWSSSNGTIAHSIATNGVVEGWSPGNATISYTLISGCYVTMPFKVENPLPASLSITQTPDTLLCAGTPVTLTANSVNGGTPTFQWNLFGGYAGSGPTYTFNATDSAHGNYYVCVMTTHNICSSPAVVQDSVVMNVFPVVGPVVTISKLQTNDTSAYLGDVFTFVTNVTYGGIDPTYQWYINSTPVPGATNSTFTTQVYNDNDTVSCMVIGTSPCYSGSASTTSTGIIIYGLGFLAVNTLSTGNSDLTLFPNPNSGSFTLSGKLSTTSGKDVSLEIADMLGRTIYTGHTTPQHGEIREEIKLDNDVAAGAYLLRVNTETGVETFHFVIGK